MAQYHSAENDISAHIKGNYVNTLDIEDFSRMLKDPAYCYKFYWLEALVILISEGRLNFTLSDVIDEMIVNAWYSVLEFHIHLSGMQLGEVRDGLERAVLKLAALSDLPASASRVEIKNGIAEYSKELHKDKTQLTHMVPFRSLAGFFDRYNLSVSWENKTQLVDQIEHINAHTVLLPYTFGRSSGLQREVCVHPIWAQMIMENTVTILGWIQFEKTKWLQLNNPEVPGLVYKLSPLNEKMRKLNNVRKLWSGILEIQPIMDVFTGQPISAVDYDVDHFIPWSFVMNDELWNLMPMDSSLNSSKSNNLPRWEPFFPRFAENQFILYQLIQEKPELMKRYKACTRDNLHSIWADQELYRPGNSKQTFTHILESNMRPVYDSAKRQGYSLWIF